MPTRSAQEQVVLDHLVLGFSLARRAVALEPITPKPDPAPPRPPVGAGVRVHDFH